MVTTRKARSSSRVHVRAFKKAESIGLKIINAMCEDGRLVNSYESYAVKRVRRKHLVQYYLESICVYSLGIWGTFS